MNTDNNIEAPAPPPPVRRRVYVPSSRLCWGRFDHNTQRDTGMGDIRRSYSADEIALHSRVRAPFLHESAQYVSVGSRKGFGKANSEEECYLLILAERCKAAIHRHTYATLINDPYAAEAARCDANGFYHGLLVQSRNVECIMIGPPVYFCPDETEAQVTISDCTCTSDASVKPRRKVTKVISVRDAWKNRLLRGKGEEERGKK